MTASLWMLAAVYLFAALCWLTIVVDGILDHWRK